MEDSVVKQLAFDSSTGKVSSAISFFDRQLKNDFFVFHKDSTKGVRFTSSRAAPMNNLDVDSFRTIVTGTNRWDSFLTIRPDSSIWSADKSELKEVFLFAARHEVPPSRLHLYYSTHLKHLNASFNRKVDSAKNMKLYKTEYIVDPFFNERNKVAWPSTKNTTEMKTLPVKDANKIMGYFSLYKSKMINE